MTVLESHDFEYDSYKIPSNMNLQIIGGLLRSSYSIGRVCACGVVVCAKHVTFCGDFLFQNRVLCVRLPERRGVYGDEACSMLTDKLGVNGQGRYIHIEANINVYSAEVCPYLLYIRLI